MTIVTLTTDWGVGSHYSGAVKGTLMKHIPGVSVVDICHELPVFDIIQASFVLKNAFPHFPEGTIHLLGINTEAGLDTPHVLIRYKGHYFIGADNGTFSLICDEAPDLAIELELLQDTDIFTFSTRDVFAKAASLLAGGSPPESLGRPYPELNKKILFRPVVYPDKIIGKVIFIDHYGNVFVNIDRPLFRETGKNRRFEIRFRSPGNAISQIHLAYSDVAPGDRLALFGSTNYLEIAINQGNASGLLGLHMNDTVSIEFEVDPMKK